MNEIERSLLKSGTEGKWAALNAMQEDSIAKIRSSKRVGIGDPTGMGKNKQIILGLNHLNRVLIVCKKRMKLTIRKEIELWTGTSEFVTIISSERTVNKEIALQSKWLITDWSTIRLDAKKYVKGENGEQIKNFLYGKPCTAAGRALFEWFIKYGWPQGVALDEFHFAANEKAGYYLGAKALAIKAEYLVPMSATFQMNKVVEIWSALSLIEPKLFKHKWKFLTKHADARPGQWGWIYEKIAPRPAELTVEIAPYIIRHPKIRPGGYEKLPPQPTYVEADADQNRLMAELETQLLVETSPNEFLVILNHLAKFTRLRQVAISAKLLDPTLPSGPKIEAAIEFLQDKVAEGKKILVGSVFRGALDILAPELKNSKIKYVEFVGGQTEKEAAAAENFFQNDPNTQVGLATLGLDGLTLTAAHTVLYLDRHLNPAVNLQFEDRVDRPSQTQDIEIYDLITENSADLVVQAIVSHKFVGSEQLYKMIEEFHLERIRRK